jgi:DNA-binding transcriptional ArsR family regulator
VDANRDADRWGALADGTRLAIVAYLAEGPRAVGQLAAGLPVALAALRDQLDTYWQRALAGYADAAEAPTEEG